MWNRMNTHNVGIEWLVIGSPFPLSAQGVCCIQKKGVLNNEDIEGDFSPGKSVGYHWLRVGPKKFVQQGHSFGLWRPEWRTQWWARSISIVREDGIACLIPKGYPFVARTPLAAFFNRPKKDLLNPNE